MQNMQNMNKKDLFSVQNQVPGLASSLPGKYGQDNCLILILSFRHCPLPLASICCGAAAAALLETVLHWQLHRHNWFYASSSPSESGPLDEGWSVWAAGGSLRWKRGRAGGQTAAGRARGGGGVSADARADAPAGGRERGRAGGRAGISKQAGVSHADVRKLGRAGIPQRARHCCGRPAHRRRLWALSSLLHRHLQAYWNLSMNFPDIIHLQFVHDFVPIVSSTSGFP